MKLLFFSTVSILLILGCNRGINNTITISGAAQGTSYHITYLAGQHSNYRESFDSIFKKIVKNPGNLWRKKAKLNKLKKYYNKNKYLKIFLMKKEKFKICKFSRQFRVNWVSGVAWGY